MPIFCFQADTKRFPVRQPTSLAAGTNRDSISRNIPDGGQLHSGRPLRWARSRSGRSGGRPSRRCRSLGDQSCRTCSARSRMSARLGCDLCSSIYSFLPGHSRTAGAVAPVPTCPRDVYVCVPLFSRRRRERPSVARPTQHRLCGPLFLPEPCS